MNGTDPKKMSPGVYRNLLNYYFGNAGKMTPEEREKFKSSLARARANITMERRMDNRGVDTQKLLQPVFEPEHGESTLNKVFTTIDKPRNWVAKNVAAPLLGLNDELAGKEQVYGSDILDKLGVKNKYARGIGGFVGDVLLDPITYLSFGTGGAAKSLAKAGIKATPQMAKRAVTSKGLKHFQQLAKSQGVENAEKALIKGIQSGELPQEFVKRAGVKFAGKQVPGTEALFEGIGKGVKAVAEKTAPFEPLKLSGAPGELGAFTTRKGQDATKAIVNLFKNARVQDDPYKFINENFPKLFANKNITPGSPKFREAQTGLLGSFNKISEANRKSITEGIFAPNEWKKITTKKEGGKILAEGEGNSPLEGILRSLGDDFVKDNTTAQQVRKELSVPDKVLQGKIIQNFRRIGSEGARTVGRLFSNSVRHGEMRDTIQPYMWQIGNVVKRATDETKEIFKGIDDIGRMRISEAIDSGQIYRLTDQKEREAAQGMINKLGEYVNETGTGKLQQAELTDSFLENYAPHRFKNLNANEWQYTPTGIRKDLASVGSYNKERKFTTYADAEEVMRQTPGLTNVEYQKDSAMLLSGYIAQAERALIGQKFYNKIADKYIEQSSGLFARASNETVKDYRQRLIKGVQEGSMPRDIAEALNDLEVYGLGDDATRKFLSWYDSGTNFFKFMATVPAPAFHFRNKMSDEFFLFLSTGANVLNPKMRKSVFDIASGKSGQMTNKLGQTLSYDDIRRVYRDIGAERHRVGRMDQIENVRKNIEKGFTKASLKHPVTTLQKAMEKPGLFLENQSVLNSFLHHWNQGSGVEEATRITKKFLLDYEDLTPFERKVMRRIVPFYTFFKKNTELQLSQLLEQPGKQAGIIRGEIRAGQEIGEKLSDEEKSVIPPFLKESPFFATGKTDRGFNVIYGFDIPIEELNKMPGGLSVKEFGKSLRKMLITQMAPLPKNVLEMVSDKDFFLGRPLKAVHEDLQTGKVTYPYQRAYAWMDKLPGWVKNIIEFEVTERKGKKYYSMNPYKRKAFDAATFGALNRIMSTAGRAFEPDRSALTKVSDIFTGFKQMPVDTQNNIQREILRQVNQINNLLRRNYKKTG